MYIEYLSVPSGKSRWKEYKGIYLAFSFLFPCLCLNAQPGRVFAKGSAFKGSFSTAMETGSASQGRGFLLPGLEVKPDGCVNCSYDIYLFLPRKPTRKECGEFFEKHGLGVVWEGKKPSFLDCYVYFRKEGKDSYVFRCDGPAAIVPEDMIDRVGGYVINPKWKLYIYLWSFSEKEVLELGRKFAIFLARLTKGCAYDPQKNEVLWPKKRACAPPPPGKEESVPLVTFRFWFLVKRGSVEKAKPVLKSLSEGIGKKIPVFYNPVFFDGFRDDPSVSVRERPAEFFRIWKDMSEGKESLFTLRSEWPFGFPSFSSGEIKEGSLPGIPGKDFLYCEYAISMDGRLFLGNLKKGKWAEPLVAFFRNNCVLLDCFFALAYVERGVKLAKGRFWGGLGFPCSCFSKWEGIPAPRAWLFRFGKPYAKRVGKGLDGLRKWMEKRPGAEILETGKGIFIRMGRKPVFLEDLLKAPWHVPEELLGEEARKYLR